MIHFNENILVAVDVETTGVDCAFHDLVQIGCLPLEPLTLDPHPTLRPFYQNIRPRNPERAQKAAMAVNGLDMDELLLCPTVEEVTDAFHDWFRSLGLPVGKRLIPLTHNSPFDIPFMQQFLGQDVFYDCFTRRGRDTMYMALGINDSYIWKGLAAPFNECGLKPLCNHFGIDISGHHDALADCIATSQVYRELLRMEHP